MSKEANLGFEVLGDTKWLGRKGEDGDKNSFSAFLKAARHTKFGRAHLLRHHGGYGSTEAGKKDV